LCYGKKDKKLNENETKIENNVETNEPRKNNKAKIIILIIVMGIIVFILFLKNSTKITNDNKQSEESNSRYREF